MGDSGIERYKRMAEQCEGKAEALPDTEEKKYFKELARQWRELAKRAERAVEQSSNEPSVAPPGFGFLSAQSPIGGAWRKDLRSVIAGEATGTLGSRAGAAMVALIPSTGSAPRTIRRTLTG